MSTVLRLDIPIRAETTKKMVNLTIGREIREWLDDLRSMGDLIYAIRLFMKDRGFAGMAIAALALGIGVNSAMFSIIDTVLFRNLSFKEPSPLHIIWQPAPVFKLGTEFIAASPGDFGDWQTQNRTFQRLAGFAPRRANLSTLSQPESVAETLVTDDFFSVFETPAYLGRLISREDSRRGENHVAVLSYRFWKQHFNGNPALVGKSIRLDDESYLVTGVMPEGFRFPEGNEMPGLYGFPPTTDIWIPSGYSEAKRHDRNNHTLLVIGRLKPGVTIRQAQADLESIQRRLSRMFPVDDKDFDVLITPLIGIIVGSFRTQLLLLFVAVGFVLLIACANVTNLSLSRANARRREIAVRMALGAPRTRLYKQLLTESVLLSFLGAIAGLFLAFVLLRVVLTFAPPTIPRLQETHLDWRVIGFTVLIGFFTGILFGILPAIRLVGGHFTGALREAGSRGQVGSGRLNFRRMLVISEVSLATVLLVGAGLALRSLQAVQAINPGFKTQRIATMDLVLPAAKYKDEAARSLFFRQAFQRVATVPGVEQAGLVSTLPLSNNENLGALNVKGRVVHGQSVPAERRWASEGYFRALAIPLMAGRLFEPSDGNPGLNSAIINEAVVRQFFPKEDALGKQVQIGHNWLTVVGVVGDVHNAKLENSPRLQVYLYYAPAAPPAMSLVVSSTRGTRADLDPDPSAANLKTMDQVLRGSVSTRRFGTAIVTIFGILALLLIMVGLYSVVTYNVTQRSREIGLRIALGAMRADVLRMVLRDALTTSGIGVVVGTTIALVFSRFAAGFIYAVPATDPITFLAIDALLVAVAAVGVYIPGSRAASTDPNIVLRDE